MWYTTPKAGNAEQTGVQAACWVPLQRLRLTWGIVVWEAGLFQLVTKPHLIQ